MIVVSDTGPLNYLILSDHPDILGQLYAKILIPPVVRDELRHPKAPVAVREWILAPPSWLTIKRPEAERGFSELGPGER